MTFTEMTLPVGLERMVEADELKAPSRGTTQGPTGSREFQELMNQINGEGESERIDLSVGGYVSISLSTFNWILYELDYQKDSTSDKQVIRAEFVDAGGHSEAVLQINRQSGEVLSVQINRRGERMVNTINGT